MILRSCTGGPNWLRSGRQRPSGQPTGGATPPSPTLRPISCRPARAPAARGTHQRRILAAALVILLIGSVVGAGIAAVAAHSANQQRAAAVSGQLAAESEALDTADPVTASLLAAAAWRIDPTPQARDSMLDVLAQPDHGVLSGSLGGGPVSAVAFSPNGKTLAAVGADGKALLWDTATHHQLRTPLGEYNEVDSAAFSPDGKTLALAGAGGSRPAVGCAHTRPDWQTSHRGQWLFLLRSPGSQPGFSSVQP